MTAAPPFAFVPAGHPFRPAIDDFAQRIAVRMADLGADESTADAAEPHVVHAEIKALPDGDGFRIERFYWSAQRWDDGPGFRAWTLEYAARDGAPRWQDFPHDSYLPALAGFFGADAAPRVLRYVPLRRFTFRADDGRGGARIGKFKRRSRYRQAYALLAAVHRAVGRGAPGFAVAAPLAIDDGRGLYFQEHLPGDDLAARLDERNAEALLFRTGTLHARLHPLPADELPAGEPAALPDAVRRDLRWIAFLRPDLADVTARAAERLVARAPGLRADAFCHGDFVCSQVLVDARQWAVTDFDLCGRGDSRRDLAIFLASLSYDVPHFAGLMRGAPTLADAAWGAARDAYLAGYAAAGGDDPRRDPRRLAWHQACAEIYYLALMLKKDRVQPAVFDAGLRRLRDALAGLD